MDILPDLPTLIKFLNDEDTQPVSWVMEAIDTSFPTLPSEFISYAEADLKSETSHKFINALSNAKRALDCQADRILKLLGFYNESQEKFWGFPKKIETINKYNILSPRILNKINKTRNALEHRYIQPIESEVEDFLDIVALYIESTDRYIENIPTGIGYENENDTKDFPVSCQNIELIFENDGLIISQGYLSGIYKDLKGYQQKIPNNHPEHIGVMSAHLKKFRKFR